MRPSDRAIQTFDPLLRDLITWSLVQWDGERWGLSERAERRLSELAEVSAPWPAEQTVYVGHRCERCDTRTLTRLREGAHVCDACWSRRGVEAPGTITAVSLRRRILHRRTEHIA